MLGKVCKALFENFAPQRTTRRTIIHKKKTSNSGQASQEMQAFQNYSKSGGQKINLKNI